MITRKEKIERLYKLLGSSLLGKGLCHAYAKEFFVPTVYTHIALDIPEILTIKPHDRHFYSYWFDLGNKEIRTKKLLVLINILENYKNAELPLPAKLQAIEILKSNIDEVGYKVFHNLKRELPLDVPEYCYLMDRDIKLLDNEIGREKLLNDLEDFLTGKNNISVTSLIMRKYE